MKRILILEPSQSFAQFLSYILKRLGYEVTHLVRSNQALETLLEGTPDLIISETTIPDIGGIEFCQKLKQMEKFSKIPVAIVSIDGSIETRQLAQKVGCVDYLTKPVTARDIHELMERHLPYHHKRHNIRTKLGVRVKIHDGKHSESLRTLSIGEGGMYLQTKQPYQVGASVEIEAFMPSLRNPLFLRGEVIYATITDREGLSRGMGIKFIGLDLNTTTLLRHYLESYLSDFLPESPLLEG
jgi:DNA-binding response OmpR family regulator